MVVKFQDNDEESTDVPSAFAQLPSREAWSPRGKDKGDEPDQVMPFDYSSSEEQLEPYSGGRIPRSKPNRPTNISSGSHSHSTSGDPFAKINPFHYAIVICGMILAGCAGMVNAISFLNLGTFVSHTTGGITRVGASVGSRIWEAAEKPLLVILSFCAGSTLCGILFDKGMVLLGHRRYGLVLACNAGLLFLAGIANKETQAPYLAAAACGLQNGLATSYTGGVIRTTHVSGATTDIGLHLGWLLKKVVRARGFSTVRYVEDIRKMMLLSLLMMSYGSGVFIGAGLFTELENMAMFVPASIVLVGGIVYTIFRSLLLKLTADGGIKECDQVLPGPGGATRR